AVRRDARRRVFLRAEHDGAAHDRHGNRRSHVTSVANARIAMSFLISAVMAIAAHLRMWVEGLIAPFQVAPAILSAKGDGLKAKAAAALQDPRTQRVALRSLRAFVPNLVLSKQLIGAYPNTGTAIVTRYQDVIEVLDRNADFEVVYEPKMRAIAGGENFFL